MWRPVRPFDRVALDVGEQRGELGGGRNGRVLANRAQSVVPPGRQVDDVPAQAAWVQHEADDVGPGGSRCCKMAEIG
jgi:hypothetical protein